MLYSAVLNGFIIDSFIPLKPPKWKITSWFLNAFFNCFSLDKFVLTNLIFLFLRFLVNILSKTVIWWFCFISSSTKWDPINPDPPVTKHLLLIKKGADINLPNYKGTTPLMYAMSFYELSKEKSVFDTLIKFFLQNSSTAFVSPKKLL